MCIVAAASEALSDPAFMETYGKGAGLCMPHLEKVAMICPPNSLRILTSIEIKRLENLHYELGEYVRKNDYNFSGEPMLSEKDAWLRSIRKLSGEIVIPENIRTP